MIDTLFIFGAKYLFVLSLIIALYVFTKLSFEERWRMIILGLTASLLALVVAIGLREIYENPRPFVVNEFEPLIPHDPDNGFPSDHTLLVATVASVVAFFHRRAALYLWLIAALVGMSRVYVGVHHFTDILGSIAISIITAFVAYAIIAAWKTHKNPTNF